ncbi:MAG: hypothetical protein GTO45_35255 [Candidatus Aminicenantes bacterium]|nr:hypothetical protein [Candidatus Aminicenantes bacterium]NIM83944.1 hypothetical protein [Candidatus Aminicenantes bacterium]NIN23413.1 hypothetical protein [Candidatus Aminicenantes bacterium]NIN47117.1 hypothetical protein [Candidatus Aminicenantes bacterium]NIN90041.1 hypothetical protein [Candidatus Aminicenantes bacterium]
MNDQKKSAYLQFFIALIVIAAMGTSVSSYIVLNYSEIAYESSNESSIAVDAYIAESAGYFLKGYSDILHFLNKVERSELDGTDYNELLDILNQAIGNMEQARMAYEKLTRIANDSPYNPAIIDRLLAFDYERFQQENELNRDIFTKVRKYLEKGDVRGIYARLLAYTTNIQNILIELKSTVERGKFPIIRGLWQLNKQCSEALLFGENVSEIFLTIKRSK